MKASSLLPCSLLLLVDRTLTATAERRDECPLALRVASDEAIATNVESFINGIVRRLVKVFELHLAIENSIGIAAMSSQVLCEELRGSVVIGSQDECLDRCEIPHLEDAQADRLYFVSAEGCPAVSIDDPTFTLVVASDAFR